MRDPRSQSISLAMRPWLFVATILLSLTLLWSGTESAVAAPPAPSYVITKTATLAEGKLAADRAGDVITYTITMTNDGNLMLSNILIVDPLVTKLRGPSGDDLNPGLLDVGESWFYTGIYTVTQGDLDSNGNGDGMIDNIVTATTTEIPTPTIALASVSIRPISELTIRLEAIGGQGVFTFTMMGDNGHSVVTLDTTLAPSQTLAIAPGTYTITESLPGGWIYYMASCSGGFAHIAPAVTLEIAAGTGVVCTFVNERLSTLTLQKVTIGGDALFDFVSTLPGYEVLSVTTRSGNGSVTLPDIASGHYTVTEVSQAGWDQTGSTCSHGSGPSHLFLAPGTDLTCTFTNTKRSRLTIVSETDGPDGAFVFISSRLTSPFTVTTISNTGVYSLTELSPTVYDVQEIVPAGWQLKHISCDNAANNLVLFGARHRYRRDFADSVTQLLIDLQPGADVTCIFVNDPLPTATVLYAATPAALPEPGGPMTLTVTVQNTTPGEALTLTSLTATPLGPIATTVISQTTGDVDTNCLFPQELTPADAVGANGGLYSCRFAVDLRGESAVYTDVVTATLVDGEGNTVTPGAEVKVAITDVEPQAVLTGVATPYVLMEPGGVVTFTLTISNVSAIDAVTLTQLVDSVYGDLTTAADPMLSTTCLVPTRLAAHGQPDASYTCTLIVDVRDSPPDVLVNTMTATVVDNEGSTDTALSSAKVVVADLTSSIKVFARANLSNLAEPGGDILLTVEVENTSVADRVTLEFLADNQFGPLAGLCPQTVQLPMQLDPGERLTCSFSQRITGNARDHHQNVVTVMGIDDDGALVSDSAELRVEITDIPPNVTVTASAYPTRIPEAGDKVLMRVMVVNNSPVEALFMTALADSVFGNLHGKGTCRLPQALVANGGQYVCTFADFVAGNAGDNHIGVVTVQVADDDGNLLTAEDGFIIGFNDILPEITVGKSASHSSVAAAGETVLFEFTITNHSVEPVTLTTLTDSVLGDLAGVGSCALPQSLRAYGGSYTCMATALLASEAGEPLQGTVTGIAEDDDGNTAEDSDDVTIQFIRAAPKLFVSKDDRVVSSLVALPNNQGKAAPGDTLRYSFLLLNNGTDSAPDVIFADNPDINTVLVPGTVTTSKGTVEVGNHDLDTQVVVNVGTIAPNGRELVRISFDVQIRPRVNSPILRNQALVTTNSDDVGGSAPNLPFISDDPATPGVADPTLTELLLAPTALDEVNEPTVPAPLTQRLFLPMIIIPQ